jgi:hypothetical protein
MKSQSSKCPKLHRAKLLSAGPFLRFSDEQQIISGRSC